MHNTFKATMNTLKSERARGVHKFYISETIKLSLITGPLYCISANYQYLSSSIMTAVKTPSILKPFKPSVYKSYKDILTSFYRQGVLAFYKGNYYRLLFFISTMNLKKTLDILIYNNFQFIYKFYIIKDILLYSLVDILMHPLLFIESRYSIQNNRKNYRIYQNTLHLLSITKIRELYQGSLLSFHRNTVMVASLYLYYLIPNKYFNTTVVFLSHLLSYPILTIQRNVIYSNYGNQNIRYLEENAKHKSRLLHWGTIQHYIETYGIVNLYRGFVFYILAVGLWHYYVPAAAKYRYYRNVFEEEFHVVK